jgi:anti-sigma B factor antagonist
MPDNLKHISAREDRGVLILTVELARISSYEQAETIGRELLAAVEGRQSAKVVVDLSKLTYMSSVGYGPLITLRSRVRADGGRLVLCGLSGVVKEVFEATRLLINPNSPKSLFEFKDTLDQAIAVVASD